MSSIASISAATAFLLLSSTAAAQDAKQVHVEAGEIRYIDGAIAGDEIDDYLLHAERAQILSVDLRTSNPSAQFNIVPEGSQQAIFIGSTSDKVADVTAPVAGTYLVRVYLVRSAARRVETAEYSLGLGVGVPEFADGLSGGPDYWEVDVDDGRALNLRAGPSTRYGLVSTLRKADVLQNRSCRMTGRKNGVRVLYCSAALGTPNAHGDSGSPLSGS